MRIEYKLNECTFKAKSLENEEWVFFELGDITNIYIADDVFYALGMALLWSTITIEVKDDNISDALLYRYPNGDKKLVYTLGQSLTTKGKQ